MEIKKSNKIREIVRLQQILKKWRKLATLSEASGNSNSNSSSSSKSIKFLKRTLSLSDNCGRETSSSNGVPKGNLAVCVGEELKRFIIPTEHLRHAAFHSLLREAEEEYGFQQTGVLRFPCEVAVFQSILKLVEEKKDVYYMQQQECLSGHCSSKNHQTPSHHPQSPMCR